MVGSVIAACYVAKKAMEITMRIIAALLLMTAPTVAMEWKDFDNLTLDQQVAFILGSGAAYEVANTRVEGGPKLYCANIEDRSEFLTIAFDTRDDEVPVELSLMLGLQAEFPCDE